MKRELVMCLAMAAAGSATAGVNGLTFASIANCPQNESVTWNLLRPHTLSTGSILHPYRNMDVINVAYDPIRNTNISIARHGEFPGYLLNVAGYHRLYKDNTDATVKYDITSVADCRQYDGWREYNL